MKSTVHRKRLDFLTTISASRAREIIDSYEIELDSESVRIEESVGRVLAEDIFSPEDLPYFDRSLVDGYAVSFKDSIGASENNPIILTKKGTVRVGELPKLVLGRGECVYANTGALIPDGADSVVMQEFARETGDFVEILRPVYKGENVIFKGEDVKKGELVLTKGKRISPFDVGVLAALGVTELRVKKRPKVGIVSTGDEIIPPQEKADSGKVRDVNGYALISLFRKLGGETTYAGISTDNIEDLMEKLTLIKESDILIISGGSSKGERDMIVEAVKELGGDLFFHGVNIRPGKPFFFGLIWNRPIFGLPGHPLSCLIVAHRFVLPLFHKLAGEREKRSKSIYGILTTNVPSTYGVEEYVNVRVEVEGKNVFVHPVFAKSASVAVLTRSSGYLAVDESKEGHEKGEEVKVYLYEI